ncbi:MAG: hypothetical protein IT175_12540 [Acidobacteria bacterium]|nr:hypothetical protein [Acidobacteriota bacterium]
MTYATNSSRPDRVRRLARSAVVRAIVLLVLLAAAPAALAAGPQHWRRAYVIDSDLAVLRREPGLRSGILKRLRHGRMIAIVERPVSVDGVAWVRVAVTRRTRGWLPVSAIASPNDRDGEARLSSRIAQTDGFSRLELTRLTIDHFPRLREQAALAFEEEARRAASALTERAARRFAYVRLSGMDELRVRMLLDPHLDRYIRLGVRFEAYPETLEYRFVATKGERAARR